MAGSAGLCPSMLQVVSPPPPPSYQECLLKLAAKGDLAEVKRLLDQGINCHVHDMVRSCRTGHGTVLSAALRYTCHPVSHHVYTYIAWLLAWRVCCPGNSGIIWHAGRVKVGCMLRFCTSVHDAPCGGSWDCYVWNVPKA